MKKIVFSCVCMAAAVVSAGMKLGVVNLEILIKNHPSHESNRALVKSTADDYRKKMEARQEKAKALVEEGKKIQSDWQNPMLSAVAKADLQKKIEEAQKKKKNTSSGGKTANQQDVKLSGEFANNKGKLPWPVNGVLVRSYGKQYHPVFKNLELPSNDGIDIAVDAGGEVCSVFEGEVLDVFVMPSYGQCVLVQHGSTYFTFYCKLGSIVVKKGEKVRTGQKLGVVEPMNGTSQIHFEIWKDKSPQNPSSWLRSK